MLTDWTKVLAWPGYRVYDYHIDEARRLLTLHVRRKPGNRKLTCAHCGRRVHDIRAVYERKVRDLPCFEFQTSRGGRVLPHPLPGLRTQSRA